MKYPFLLILLVSTIHTSFAQDLVNRIPSTASAVAVIKTQQLTGLLSADEISKTATGKKLFSFIAEKSGKEIAHLDDAGIRLNANTYYFYLGTDSIGYHCLLVPVAEASKMDSLLGTKNKVSRNGLTRLLYSEDSATITMWNDKQLLQVTGSLKTNFFYNEDVMNRYGITTMYYSPYSTTEAVDSLKTYMDEPSEKLVPSESDTTTVVEEEVVIGMDSAAEAATSYNEAAYEKDAATKKALSIAWTKAMLHHLFNTQPASAITTNAAYMSSVDEKAAVTLWISGLDELYSNIVPLYKTLSGNTAMSFYKSMIAKLYFEDKRIRMTTSLEMPAEQAESYSRIYNSKLNKKMLRYVNADSALGYMAFSVNSKAYLEELPNILNNVYSGEVFNSMRDEMTLVADFIELLLDEEAISKVIKGDGMMVFNGVYQQEVTYTDYAYDENFNKTEVEKIKTETLPSFLLMLGSEDAKFVNKLVRYGIKKNAVEQQGAFYRIKIPKSDISFYFVHQDGIFFLTNSVADINAVCTGTFKAGINKQQAKTLREHNFYVYANPAKIASKLPANMEEPTKDYTSMLNTLQQCGDIYLWSNPIKSNIMSGEMVMEVPPGNSNSVKYLFSIIDKLIK